MSVEVLVVRKLEEEEKMATKDREQAKSQMICLLFLMLHVLEGPGLSRSHMCRITVVMTENIMNSI